jgi:DNA-binding NarL/FixJ family response regulator
MRLVLGSDHRLFVDALADVLLQQGVTVAARAHTPHDVLVQVAKQLPDVCLIADRWLSRDGIASLRQICSNHPGTKLVILSEGSAAADVVTAVDIGAAAVVSQYQHVSELINVLHRVRAGERPIDAATVIPAIRNFTRPVSSYGDRLLDMLTIREQEVLKLMTDGQATKEIAKALAITLNTARTHVQSVLVKLGVHSRLEASGIVGRSGLLSLPGQFGARPVAQKTAVGG